MRPGPQSPLDELRRRLDLTGAEVTDLHARLLAGDWSSPERWHVTGKVRGPHEWRGFSGLVYTHEPPETRYKPLLDRVFRLRARKKVIAYGPALDQASAGAAAGTRTPEASSEDAAEAAKADLHRLAGRGPELP